MKRNNLYIVWNPFQRRAESLANEFNFKIFYYYHSWEEKGMVFKLISYLTKSIFTLKDLIRNKPQYIFLQLAPTPLLYTGALYCLFADCKYIADCHNTMIYDSHWIHWPFAKRLLCNSHITIVHNDDVKYHANNLKIHSVILRDPLPSLTISKKIKKISNINLTTDTYIIVPCSMAIDEPIAELFEAAKALPKIRFVFTWFEDRIPAKLRAKAPSNLTFTGFLKEQEFNSLYAHANAAVVLTTRQGTQPSGASEAISLGIPLVISKIDTTTRLYENKPIYVENDSESISNGIRLALSDFDKHSSLVYSLKKGLILEAKNQINFIKEKLS